MKVLLNSSLRKTYSKLLGQNLPTSYCCQTKTGYKTHYDRSIKQSGEYWAEAAEKLTWFKKWDSVIDHSNPPFTKWFSGGEISHCFNAVDRHVDEGRGSQVAIIHDSPVTNTVAKITYAQLQDQVSKLAGVLSKLGVRKGDRVMVYMPMVPQAVIAMMATIRLGGIHVVVFGGFASKELSLRIDNCRPKVIISASCGVEPSRTVRYKPMLDEAISHAQHKPLHTIIYQRPDLESATLIKGRDLDWAEVLDEGKPHDCVPVESNHPMYLLYTSGTTGLPKAVVRPTAGHSVVLHWSMKAIYDVNPGEVFWSPSDLGWIVGHSYVCHAPLVYGATTLIFEGKPVGTPDASTFFRIIDHHRVACFFVAPTALRSVKGEDPEARIGKNFDLSSLRTLFVAGEHCDTDTTKWSKAAFNGVPVLDHWWQTETGHPITSTCVGLGNKLDPPFGSTGVCVPGWDLRVVDREGKEVERGQLGNLVAKLPLPLGSFQTLWENEERFRETYFRKYPGFYDTMDAGVMDEEGYISVMSRTDDVINVAGHRLSCGHIEEVINCHSSVVECAVVAKDDALKGSTPFGFIVVQENADKEKLPAEITQLVRDGIGPVAAFKEMVFVEKLPKTRSGKIPRNTLQAICNGKPYKISPTIEDPTVYPLLEEIVNYKK